MAGWCYWWCLHMCLCVLKWWKWHRPKLGRSNHPSHPAVQALYLPVSCQELGETCTVVPCCTVGQNWIEIGVDTKCTPISMTWRVRRIAHMGSWACRSPDVPSDAFITFHPRSFNGVHLVHLVCKILAIPGGKKTSCGLQSWSYSSCAVAVPKVVISIGFIIWAVLVLQVG